VAEPLVECVPNFSEGRDPEVLASIARAIESTDEISLLGSDCGAAANRSVFTFAGPPRAVAEAVLASARTAFGLIDMARHRGVHPRMGALDVCPFVPLAGSRMDECVELSRETAGRLSEELGVPVYLYEESASRPERRSLAFLRAGGYEALPGKLSRSEWAPDFGRAVFVPRWGATVMGARPFLIAFNVNLDSRDVGAAKAIAARIRESGGPLRESGGGLKRGADGEVLRAPGRLRGVRAIGWLIEEYGCAQVSINILDFKASPLHAVFEAVREEAAELGIGLRGSEMIGLVPLEAMVEAGRFYSRGKGSEGGGGGELLGDGEEGQALVRSAVSALGLEAVASFPIREKIVEYALAARRRRG